jgi:hypothetical protein
MQGNCAEPFEEAAALAAFTFHPPMLQRKPSQCAIVIESIAMEFERADAKVWLDNVYFRVQRPEATLQHPRHLLSFSSVSAWLTNVTIQGDSGVASALYPYTDAKVFLQGASSCSPRPWVPERAKQQHLCGQGNNI